MQGCVVFQVVKTWIEHQENKDGFYVILILNKPASRGTIRLKSTNPFHHPLIDPNFLDKEEDVQHLLSGKHFQFIGPMHGAFQELAIMIQWLSKTHLGQIITSFGTTTPLGLCKTAC